ncbi:MAG: hypothetical protein KBD01_11085 [Acidobacteria bacterium]|nr:hypothetical protein [Acidobacteriota bacterium]
MKADRLVTTALLLVAASFPALAQGEATAKDVRLEGAFCKGSPQARLTVVTYVELGRFWSRMDWDLAEFIDRDYEGTLRYCAKLQVPPQSPGASEPAAEQLVAIAVRCLAEQSEAAFWEAQGRYLRTGTVELRAGKVRDRTWDYVEDDKLDKARFRDCYKTQGTLAAVKADDDEAQALGIAAPLGFAFVVDGSLSVHNPSDYDDSWLRKEIDSALLEADWRATLQANTRRSFSEFRQAHPKSSHVEEAGQRIEELEWEAARAANTYEAYSSYLLGRTLGPHVDEARTAMLQLSILGLKLTTTKEPQALAGDTTLVAAPLGGARMETGAASEIRLVKGNVFLMAEFSFKAAEDLNLARDAVLHDAAGNEYDAFVRSPMLFALGWTTGGFSISQSGPNSQHCMWVVPEKALDGAVIHLWGKEFPVGQYLKR